jgi:hypothetical protein
MVESCSVVALARPLIEQCRREIEAGWQQLEAARKMLARSRWLLARWEAQRRASENSRAQPPSPPAEMFVWVATAGPRRRKRHCAIGLTARGPRKRPAVTKAVALSERSSRA